MRVLRRWRIVVLWLLMFLVIRRRRNSDRWFNRQWLVRPINQRREFFGAYNTLFQELKEDPVMFHRYIAMDLSTFNYLLEMVHPHLLKDHPRALVPEERLAMTLRYNLFYFNFIRQCTQNFFITLAKHFLCTGGFDRLLINNRKSFSIILLLYVRKVFECFKYLIFERYSSYSQVKLLICMYQLLTTYFYYYSDFQLSKYCIQPL